jgi:hypothetical protein
MNEVEKMQLCDTAFSALSHGEGLLKNFPGLLQRIIEEKAWENRKVQLRGIVTLKSLRELITLPPMEGWAEDVEKIKALLKDDPLVLAMFEEELKEQHGGDRRSKKARIKCSNPTLDRVDRGKAYTVSRLQRERPDLFQQVCEKKISANAAAIQAGFRRVKTPLDNLRSAWGKASEEEREAFKAEITTNQQNL